MFRTPLNVIREYTSLIREGVRGEVNVKQGDLLDVVGYRIDDLNTMVDDALCERLGDESTIEDVLARPQVVPELTEDEPSGVVKTW